jgi:GNAT superfamily N-acetyltransferase
MKFEDFARWYVELGRLKIFWAKPVQSISLLSKEDNNLCLVSVKWIVRGGIRSAVLAIAGTQHEVPKIVERLKGYENSAKILMVPEGSCMDLNLVNASSVLYFWDVVGAKTLEPNRDVEVKICRKWNESDLEKFKSIHKQSWGFFVPPRGGDHAILIASLGGSPVGMAYLNIRNFNIDYGIHVIKPWWRRRIGTTLLVKALRLAGSMGASWVSVVRVFRSIRGTSSDARAVGFYRANNPFLKMSVYRIKN